MLFMSALLSVIVYKMVEDKSLPIILDETFFQIVKEIDNKVIDKCINCVRNELSGARNATSNFLFSLFSIAGLIETPRQNRRRLSDAMFEKLTLLKLNQGTYSL